MKRQTHEYRNKQTLLLIELAAFLQRFYPRVKSTNLMLLLHHLLQLRPHQEGKHAKPFSVLSGHVLRENHTYRTGHPEMSLANRMQLPQPADLVGAVIVSLSSYVYQFSCAWKMLFLWSHLLPPAPTISLHPLLRSYLSLEEGSLVKTFYLGLSAPKFLTL